MFRGTHRHSLDGKGRLSVPARFRDWLASHCDGQLVVTIDPFSQTQEERCLVAYPLPHWEALEQRVASLPGNNPTARRFQRLFIGHSEELRLDAQARILLSPGLRQFANLEKDVVLVGQIEKFEIWDAVRWDASQENWLAAREDFSSLGDLVL
ncbi:MULTISPECIES: division/cell wall cluster transcriptional repressor MraZ [Acidithiobacillus]|jgi:MraZ protein|uniref:Transcriptional regulator MraZ n=3 Tax=Acidithiobacillus caldus TaxID=33059 RepID=F9ZQV8_ACICS|nr:MULTISPECIES: division/cell wall cluster transcriptional repressor MraZ [Acidithiobacillus]AEK59297.1 Cell division protein MraZ [Acidithiobacillus caldus SM-1]AIA56341.1 Cell division protein MraZ [Acidithiobacillus caldus ATCC 51756]AUW33678.1 division/cell wall cluster transcriptional repressor MraZ [Acidithiobacillus caldus]MBU2730965.1 division/cell wall cluster transcriptional repressor MraZ [Acidithiobacillus caldus]MBU2735373.1 division/cell wall cluster transcriptional repressor Mr